MQKVELRSTLRNMLPQLATSKFVAWQVESEGGNTGNNAFQLATQQCCATSCAKMLPVLLDLRWHKWILHVHEGLMQSIEARSIQPKFQPVRPGKWLVYLKRWTRFFETFPVGPNRSTEFWTEIFRKFWLNGSRSWRLDSKIWFPATTRRRWPRFKADAYLEKKIVLHFTCHAIGNGLYCCLNIGKFLLMLLLTCSKFKEKNVTHLLLSLSLIFNLIKVKLDVHSVLSILYFPAPFMIYNPIKVSLFIRLLKQTKAK